MSYLSDLRGSKCILVVLFSGWIKIYKYRIEV